MTRKEKRAAAVAVEAGELNVSHPLLKHPTHGGMAEKRRSACTMSLKAHAFSVEALIGAEKRRKLEEEAEEEEEEEGVGEKEGEGEEEEEEDGSCFEEVSGSSSPQARAERTSGGDGAGEF